MQNNWILAKGCNVPWEAKIDLAVVSQPQSLDCYILAENDVDAVKIWIRQFNENPATQRAYEKEAERLLLWCMFEKGMSIAALKLEDFEEYFDFLQNPHCRWLMSKKDLRLERYSLKWRPLIKPLKKSSLLFAIRVINSLINYLVEARYLKSNPIKLIKKYRNLSNDVIEPKYQVWARMLEHDEWSAVEDTIQQLPEEKPKEQRYKLRVQLLFALLYLLGLRIHEVKISVWGSFRKLNGNWWFFIKGKGGKLGHIPVNDQLLSIIKIYRLSLNKMSLPTDDELEPILAHTKTRKPLSVRQLFTYVKAIGKLAAQKFTDNLAKKQKLEKLSPHWLRHLSASHQDLAGISGTMIQANHRHESYSTTQIYLHAPDEMRFREMQKLRINVSPKLYVKPEEQVDSRAQLKLSLVGSSLGGFDSLKRLIKAIENQVLSDFKWSRFGELTEIQDIINKYQEVKIFKRPLEICYKLEGDLGNDKLNALKNSILKEAEIRLFKCTIDLNKVVV